MRRREALRALGGLGLALSAASGAAGEEGRPMVDERPLRLGVIGCAEGTHGKVWSEILASPEGAEYGMLPYRLWDADAASSEALARATGAEAVADPRAVAEGADGVIVAELYPDRYLELSRPFLEAGMPVFYNRPFAGSVADAREILALAERHGAPIYSASALDHTEAGPALRARLPELGELRLFHMTGPTDHLGFYLPHCIAALTGVLGTGIREVRTLSLRRRPEAPRTSELPVVAYAEFAAESEVGAARGVLDMVGAGAEWYAFSLSLFGTKADSGPIRFEVTYAPLLRELARFLRTGEEPIAREALFAKTAIYYAILDSAERDGAPVAVERRDK